MNHATAEAMRNTLYRLDISLERARSELDKLEHDASELRQNIAYMEDCKRQYEEDTPRQLAQTEATNRLLREVCGVQGTSEP